jgi:8-oxo-dGTP diphosphatase
MSTTNNTITQRIAMKAVIANSEGKVLVVRIADTPKAGPNAGKYGLTGGKLKAGEKWDDGLIRETKEETGLVVEVLKPLHVGEWRPIVQSVQLQIVGVFLECSAKKFEVTLSAENDDYQWVDVALLKSLDVLEPDRTVVLSYLNTK